jgi:acetyltransferase-like isoleucine patch superfamily enzyme
MKTTFFSTAINFVKTSKSKIFTKILASSFKKISSKSTIIPPFRFQNLQRMTIGKEVTIHSNCWIMVYPGYDREESSNLVIKENTSIGMGSTISAIKKIIIEENVVMSRNVYISDHSHKFEDISIPIKDQGIDKIEEVVIGRDTWLGQNSVILPGVKIGRHCIVGANSVVNRSIPDYCVVVGAPARIIRRYNEYSGQWEKVSKDE